MEDFDDPTESLHEKIIETAQEKRQRWSLWVAISTALLAVCAAITGLLAGHHSNEALIDQIKASDQWAYYQAKGIKADIISYSSNTVKDTARIKKLKGEQAQIQNDARENEKSSKEHLAKHIILARAVTLFQVAIAIAAISIVTGKKFLWMLSILIGIIGLVFFLEGFTVSSFL